MYARNFELCSTLSISPILPSSFLFLFWVPIISSCFWNMKLLEAGKPHVNVIFVRITKTTIDFWMAEIFVVYSISVALIA